MKILGIWDGHDAGAALIEKDKILFAVNEERFTGRKLEIAFPEKSINACLTYTGTSKGDIKDIAISTSDIAKTLSRIFPILKENYYHIRRRLTQPGKFSSFKKKLKYKLTEYPSTAPSYVISRSILRHKLTKMGFGYFTLHLVDHHLCHAATAAFCSGFDKGLIVTLDGLGDGLSGSIYRYENDCLLPFASLSARHSLGIFFEHVTNLLNMRELEDEGKVMALANYAYPVDDDHNPFIDLIHVDGLTIQCRYPVLKMYEKMKDILWRYPSEQFAYMAQRTLEIKILELVKNAIDATGFDRIALAGGVFSNVKVNRCIRLMPGVRACYVFPHMGDGGLALGAAFIANHRLYGIAHIPLHHLFRGPHFSDEEIESALIHNELRFHKSANMLDEVADMIAGGEIIFWFQGAMELGPRALGGRSIIARPDNTGVKDELNLKLKKRVWYQPFCPTMLEEDAIEILEDYDGNPNPFMTMAYMVKKDKRHEVQGVINVDGSCRPQILGQEDTLFRQLLLAVKQRTGNGVILNTSLNIHGEPLVCTPDDALKTMIKSGCRHMAIGNFIVNKE